MFSNDKKLPGFFPEQLYHFKFPQAMYDSIKFSTSSSAFGVLTIFILAINRCIRPSYYGFSFKFAFDKWQNDKWHFFMCLFATRISSLKKYLFQSFAQVIIGFSGFLLLNFGRSLYILYRRLSWICGLQVFASICSCAFFLLMGSFAAQVFNLNKVSLLIFISQIEMLVL